MTGQDAAKTAKAFSETLPLTGVILTKTDGDARGGAALSVRHVTGKPVKFIGVGEKSAALEVFHPDRIAARILGQGDMLGLIEETARKVDTDEAQKLAAKFKSKKSFDLADYQEQMQQMEKMAASVACWKNCRAVRSCKRRCRRRSRNARSSARLRSSTR